MEFAELGSLVCLGCSYGGVGEARDASGTVTGHHTQSTAPASQLCAATSTFSQADCSMGTGSWVPGGLGRLQHSMPSTFAAVTSMFPQLHITTPQPLQAGRQAKSTMARRICTGAAALAMLLALCACIGTAQAGRGAGRYLLRTRQITPDNEQWSGLDEETKKKAKAMFEENW